MTAKEDTIKTLSDLFPSTDLDRIIYMANRMEMNHEEELVPFITELLTNEFPYFKKEDVATLVKEILKLLEESDGD